MRVLALSLVGLSLALVGSGLSLYARVGAKGTGWALLYIAIVLAFGCVGALVMSRQPGNTIGWILCGSAAILGLLAFADAYSAYWLSDRPVVRPDVVAAGWISGSAWVLAVFVPAVFVPLLFPDGRLLSRRWQPVIWCAAIGLPGLLVAFALAAGPFEGYPWPNPYPVDSPLLFPGLVVSAVLAGTALVLALVSSVVRWRRSHGVARQQVKWLAWSGGVVAAVFLLASIVRWLVGDDLANAAGLLSLCAFPVATGVAILRYRLYDIDVVINRTLVYGLLTVLLAATYVGSVLLLQLALRPLTRDSGLAVAASTLAVAALFRPLRSRIQALVDRRFYRSRYDAARVVQSFGTRLRHELDLDALSSELRVVVRDTVHPTHVSLWLRKAGR